VRVLVDTSVWADFFNEHSSPQAELLAQLIEDEAEIVTCGVVMAEFFQGIRRRETLADLESYFRDMESLAPREPESYFAAANLYRELRARGVTVRSTIDCLIACLAEENEVRVLAKDRDIVGILDSGLSRARGLNA
jgi:predicted nucleic acid-binding protein